jgi:BlaI family transcriptional regulator, penicillinase repressor
MAHDTGGLVNETSRGILRTPAASTTLRVNLPGRDLEHAVLSALWEHGPSRARDVHEHVGAPRGLAYTTIATALDRLHTKALVERHKQGKTLIYRARVQRETIMKAFAREAVRSLLGDRPQPAMAALVEAVEAVDPDLIAELERLVLERRRATKRG